MIRKKFVFIRHRGDNGTLGAVPFVRLGQEYTKEQETDENTYNADEISNLTGTE